MSHKQIYYSDKYDDDKYEYRLVTLGFLFVQHALKQFVSVNVISSNRFNITMVTFHCRRLHNTVTLHHNKFKSCPTYL